MRDKGGAAPDGRRRAGENEIVALLHRYAPVRQKGLRGLKKGIGDDAAVWLPPGAGEFCAATTDMLVEEIDFRRDWSTPGEIGHKSLAVNLSDLGAMGVRPRFFTVALALPADIDTAWIRKFYDGMAVIGRAEGAALVGGDLSGGEKITIAITAFGESLHRKILYRSGARPGDRLYVTGALGKSAAGLHLLRQGVLRPRSGAQREALRAHRTPTPRCAAALWLAQSGCVRAMMDLSDGLSTDLPRLCAASGTDAVIVAEKIPCFAPAVAWDCDPLGLALDGGEDYELLFAVSRTRKAWLERNYPPEFPPLTHIGNMVEGRGRVWLETEGKAPRRLPARGFDHFTEQAVNL